MKSYDMRHGGAFDRGSADSYYGRPYHPHYYVEGTYTSEKITKLSLEEEKAYKAGWDENEISGDRKDWS